MLRVSKNLFSKDVIYPSCSATAELQNFTWAFFAANDAFATFNIWLPVKCLDTPDEFYF